MPNVQNTQATPGTQGVQATQNNHNVQNITVNNHPRPSSPDETSYSMPPDPAWVYGNPNLTYGGQMPSEGVSLYTMNDSMPLTDPSAAPMPIPGLNGEPQAGTGISASAEQSQRMKNPLDMAATHMPSNSEEAYQASLRSLLDRNIGYFVVATFLIGTQQSVTWQGILHTVGSDYIVLYQPDYERYISCDFFSIKFVQFHNVKGVPYCAASQNWQGHASF